MNSKTLVTQVKRELWENKVSFVNTPIIISLLVIVMTIIGLLYSNKITYRDGEDFHFSADYSSSDPKVSVETNQPASSAQSGQIDSGKRKFIREITKDPKAFNGYILAIMYVNCVLLFSVFSIVLGAYALRCLFDDRKNKDILFWRSMPVSETTNVLVKLAMVMLTAPIIILVLNLIVTLAAFFIGLIFLGINGIGLGYLISSALSGGAFYIPFQILYELIFSLLMLLPVIGFAFFASAFARKTPFFTFMSPLMLVLADRVFNAVFGINIGIVDVLALYGRAISNTRGAFVLQESFIFESSMILPLLICIAIGSAFIAGAIWLRNYRYEI